MRRELIIKIIVITIIVILLLPPIAKLVFKNNTVCHEQRSWHTVLYGFAHVCLAVTPGLHRTISVNNVKYEGYSNQSTLIDILYLLGRYEPNTTHYLTNKPRPKGHKVFVDVGANEGYFTILMAGLGYHVYAIEPSPSNVRILKKNIKLNGFEDRVTVIQAAVSNKKELITFNESNINRMWSRVSDTRFGGLLFTSIKVQADLLDNLIDEKVDIIKMDVEDHTLQAMEGARTMFADTSTEWILELNTSHVDDKQVYSMFSDKGTSILKAKMNSLSFCDDHTLVKDDGSPAFANYIMQAA